MALATASSRPGEDLTVPTVVKPLLWMVVDIWVNILVMISPICGVDLTDHVEIAPQPWLVMDIWEMILAMISPICGVDPMDPTDPTVFDIQQPPMVN
jgi:hypothetical protein